MISTTSVFHYTKMEMSYLPGYQISEDLIELVFIVSA